MRGFFITQNKNSFYRGLCGLLTLVLSISLVLTPSAGYAQSINLLNLPIPGTMLAPSPAFVPVLLKGMTVHPEDPFQFDFIIDSGNTEFSSDQVKEESERLVKYFLASMTVPKDDLWVKLSPYENDAVNTGTGAPRTAFPEKTMAAMKNNQPKKSWYGQDEPWLNQTRQTLSSLKQTRTKEEKTTDRMVHGAWFMVDKNRRELSLYEKKILPLSKAALDVSDREYESGSIPFSQAIDSYTFWLGVKLTIARKKSGLGSSIAALEQVMGKSL